MRRQKKVEDHDCCHLLRGRARSGDNSIGSCTAGGSASNIDYFVVSQGLRRITEDPEIHLFSSIKTHRPVIMKVRLSSATEKVPVWSKAALPSERMVGPHKQTYDNAYTEAATEGRRALRSGNHDEMYESMNGIYSRFNLMAREEIADMALWSSRVKMCQRAWERGS